MRMARSPQDQGGPAGAPLCGVITNDAARSGRPGCSRYRALAPLVLILIGGCELAREPTPFEIDDEAVAVHAMLVAGEPRIAILVTRFEPPYQQGGNPRLLPVAGADVHVTGAGHTVTPVGDQPTEDCLDDRSFWWPDSTPLSPGCYTAEVEGGIRAGAAYELHIVLPNGDVVTGSTEVPDPIAIRSPAEGSRLEVYREFPDGQPLQPFPLTWRDAGPDRAVHLNLEAYHPDCSLIYVFTPNNSGQTSMNLTAQDSANVEGWVVSCHPQPTIGEIDGALNLAVFDTAYAHYFDHASSRGSLEPWQASLGVAGASGLFVAAAVARLPVRLVFR